MSEVKRYTMVGPDWEAAPDATGKWIRASDYDAAQVELAALREELAISQRGLANCKLALNAQTHNYGITNLRLTAAEQRNSALAEMLSKGFNCMERSSGKYRITMDFRTGDECFEAYSAICNLCHCDSLVREPQPTESGASECICWLQPQEPQCVDCPNRKSEKSGASE